MEDYVLKISRSFYTENIIKRDITLESYKEKALIFLNDYGNRA